MGNPYREILQALADEHIHYLVVGGVAVNLHGYRRFTGDLDILLALDLPNLERMTAMMHRLGYIERLPIPLTLLADEDQVRRFLAEKGMTAYTFQSANRLAIGIDVLAGASLQFVDFDARKVTIDFEDGLRVPVISLDDLLQMKREANREQDVLDIKMLLELKGL